MSSIGSAPPPPSPDASGQAQAEGTAGGSHEGYRLLDAGEVIAPDDEYYAPLSECWFRVQPERAGTLVKAAYRPIRRRAVPVTVLVKLLMDLQRSSGYEPAGDWIDADDIDAAIRKATAP